MRAVLDAGVFVAVERRDREVGAVLRVLQQRSIPLWTSAAVLAQIWRDGARQALVSRLLFGVGIRPLNADDGKRAGELLGATKTRDVVDAHLALVVAPGDHVLTNDPAEIDRLLSALHVDATVVRV